jgi:predicted acetyltransferase
VTDPTVRVLAPDELEQAGAVVAQGMLGDLSPEVRRGWASLLGDDVTHGSFAPDGRLVGAARWFSTRLSTTGDPLPAAGVTAVAVLSTHRRQGHLTRLMHAQLASIAEREVPVAVLTAAEYPIYHRFGYGPMVVAVDFALHTPTVRFRHDPTGTTTLVDPAELRPALEAAHDARWARTPGAITRPSHVWDHLAALRPFPGAKDAPGLERGAVWHDAAGHLAGAVAYKVEERWTHHRPDGHATVHLLVGATPEAERELWRHVAELDWVTCVDAEWRGRDDPLPHWLVDARAASHGTSMDSVWARILDVPTTVGALRSVTERAAVIDVVDGLGYGTGRWQVTIGPEGASARPTTASPDVRLAISALGAVFLGGQSVVRLHETGWLDEEAPGGVARVAHLFATPSLPWCPTDF